MLTRRKLLAGAAAAAVLPSMRLARAAAIADELPKDVRITRVVRFDLPLRRAKVAGRNAQKEVHGDTSSDGMAWIFTTAGVEGIGACGVDERAARALLGKDPVSFFRSDARRMASPLGAGSMPLWDILGKLARKPAYALLGGSGTEKVPVYDGSIYFADLLPQYADRWQDRFKEEIDQGRERGHVAFKIKIGRGHKWMPREAGDARDVEVVKLIRRHCGGDAILGVDANNGYDERIARRFIDATADAKLAFVEELFEERVEPCLDLKKQIAARGLETLVADGETQGKLDPFKPLVEAKAVDVLQGDMKHFGFEGILDEAAMAAPQGILVAPHNWGSLLGYYMQLHVGRAIKNFYRAEHDPLSSDLLIAEGYAIKEGESTVPDAPGFSLRIDREKFHSIKPRFDIRA